MSVTPITYKRANHRLDRTSLHQIVQARIELSREVHDFKQVVHQWCKNSSLLTKITAVLADAFIRLNSEGRIIGCNPSACAMFDVNDVEIMGKHINVLLKEDWSYLLESGHYSIETTMRTWDKRDISVVISLASSHNDYALVIRDVTKELQRELDIKLLMAALDNVKDRVVLTNSRNQILFVNQAFLNKLGYEKDELIGLSPKTYLSEESANHIKSLWSKIVAKPVTDTLQLVTKDGKLLLEKTTLSAVCAADMKTPAYFISIGTSE